MTKFKIITVPVATTNRELDLVNLTEYLTKTVFKGEWQGGGMLGGEFGYGVEYKNDIFLMSPYYWGECTCGWDALDFDENHKKDCFQNKMARFEKQLRNKKVKYYSDEWVEKVGQWARDNGNKDGWDGSGTYCDCDQVESFKEWFRMNRKGKNGHSEKCALELPNFKHKASGLEVRWYKWIGRDMEYNKKITDKDWKKIMNECIKSIELTGAINL